jgi:hypothetical protein
VVPFHLHYDLTRRERLAAQLESWAPCLAACVGFSAGVSFLGAVVSPWFFALLVFPAAVSRRFVVWLVGLAAHPACPVDLDVGETEIRLRVGAECASLPLAGLVQVCRGDGGKWTLIHADGTVLNVPAAALAPDQLDFLKAAARRARGAPRDTP